MLESQVIAPLLPSYLMATINCISFMSACVLFVIRCAGKNEAGFTTKSLIISAILFVVPNVALVHLVETSFLPLCINLLLAMLLPELWHLFKDFGYLPSAKVSFTILFFDGLSGWAVAPFVKERLEANTMSILIVGILATAVMMGVLFLLGIGKNLDAE